MTITNHKPYLYSTLLLILCAAAPHAYGDQPYYGTSHDYQPGPFQRSGANNPIMQKLLPPDVYNQRRANFEQWDSMTPEEQEAQRKERFRKQDFRQPAPDQAKAQERMREYNSQRQPQQNYQNPAPGGVGIDQEDGRALYNAPAQDSGDYYPPAANEGYSPPLTQR